MLGIFIECGVMSRFYCILSLVFVFSSRVFFLFSSLHSLSHRFVLLLLFLRLTFFPPFPLPLPPFLPSHFPKPKKGIERMADKHRPGEGEDRISVRSVTILVQGGQLISRVTRDENRWLNLSGNTGDN